MWERSPLAGPPLNIDCLNQVQHGWHIKILGRFVSFFCLWTNYWNIAIPQCRNNTEVEIITVTSAMGLWTTVLKTSSLASWLFQFFVVENHEHNEMLNKTIWGDLNVFVLKSSNAWCIKSSNYTECFVYNYWFNYVYIPFMF